MLFIVNPAAARGSAAREWESARRELHRLSIAFREHQTTRATEAAEVTRQALRSGEDGVIAVGGDGTLNEVVNGYFDEAGCAIEGKSWVGLLPCGTGSDYRRTIGLPKRVDALRAIRRGETRRLDVVRVELEDGRGQAISRHSINVASFGLGAKAVALVNSWRKSWPSWIGGHARFLAAALIALKTYRNRPVNVLLDGAQDLCIHTDFLVVANGRFAGGGMKLAPQAQINDGLLDVVLTHEASRLDIIKQLPLIRFGAHLRSPKVRIYQARDVAIACHPPMPVEVDGEFAGYTPARLVVKPEAIRFLA
jgi:YegS/Rv2252/BmrU family lipid kinase